MKIFIGNMTEGSATYIKGIRDEKERARLIAEDNSLADRFIFSCQDDTILINPLPIDEEFKQDALKILGLKNFTNWHPAKNSVSLCRDIEEDKELFKKLIDFIRKSKEKVEIIAYCNTPEFKSLIVELKSRGLIFETPEAPDLSFYWTVSFLDSKGGFRQIVQAISGWEKEVKMPWGIICAKPTEARKIGMVLFSQKKGFVVKTNWGQSGEGLIIIRRDNGFNDYQEASEFLKKEFEKENYWERYPIVVEEYIPPNLAIGGGAPNVECYISPEGKPEILYICGMRLTREGNFRGVEIGKNIFSEEIETKMKKIGLVVGEEFADLGLRGFYEVDMQAGLDGEIYCLESNVRRTGGTHVYEAARRIFGNDFYRHKYIVSNNYYRHDAIRHLNYNKLKTILEPIWFPISQNQTGFLPTIINVLSQGALGYIVVGNSKEETEEIETKFKELLDKVSV